MVIPPVASLSGLLAGERPTGTPCLVAPSQSADSYFDCPASWVETLEGLQRKGGVGALVVLRLEIAAHAGQSTPRVSFVPWSGREASAHVVRRAEEQWRQAEASLIAAPPSSDPTGNSSWPMGLLSAALASLVAPLAESPERSPLPAVVTVGAHFGRCLGGPPGTEEDPGPWRASGTLLLIPGSSKGGGSATPVAARSLHVRALTPGDWTLLDHSAELASQRLVECGPVVTLSSAGEEALLAVPAVHGRGGGAAFFQIVSCDPEGVPFVRLTGNTELVVSPPDGPARGESDPEAAAAAESAPATVRAAPPKFDTMLTKHLDPVRAAVVQDLALAFGMSDGPHVSGTLIGIDGPNGKTAICHWAQALVSRLDVLCATEFLDCRSLALAPLPQAPGPTSNDGEMPGHEVLSAALRVRAELFGAMSRCVAAALDGKHVLLVLDNLEKISPPNLPITGQADDPGVPLSSSDGRLVGEYLKELVRTARRDLSRADAPTGRIHILATCAGLGSVEPALSRDAIAGGPAMFARKVAGMSPGREDRRVLLLQAAGLCVSQGEDESQSPGPLAGDWFQEAAFQTEGFSCLDIEQVVLAAGIPLGVPCECAQPERAAICGLPRRDKGPCLSVAERLVDAALGDFVPVARRATADGPSAAGAQDRRKGDLADWSSFIGSADAVNALRESIEWPIRYSHLFGEEATRRRSPGVLLFGPSGSGKTALGLLAARMSRLPVVHVPGPSSVLDKYVGGSEQRVRALFARARASRPCILFFDEFEAIAPRRGGAASGGGGGGGGGEGGGADITDRVVNALLTELDGVDGGLEGVFVMAASSRPWCIDPALLRPGRIERRAALGLPSLEEAAGFLASRAMEAGLRIVPEDGAGQATGKGVDAGVAVRTDSQSGPSEGHSWLPVAELCAGWSCPELDALLMECRMAALRRVFEHQLDRSSGEGAGPPPGLQVGAPFLVSMSDLRTAHRAVRPHESLRRRNLMGRAFGAFAAGDAERAARIEQVLGRLPDERLPPAGPHLDALIRALDGSGVGELSLA
ncbi:hypothetical protein H696_02292 [Fonticula alba]|uniref:AAA+ ATPase domain-containing protein n=1 Tax=Fonticula alba TaxID=691883 RepID=A0A058ZAF4_FONAL|nr:hypothetical protein H696_02292 [Fonticula alba]KCV71344.1 hypothetical protein H696_02292 [Fonticula alba]|eukprot:XP_009494467.1 hypothetical protein H696_02292 [Fonticula alba]